MTTRTLSLLFLSLACGAPLSAGIAVSNVRASQRAGSNVVDIHYTLSGATEPAVVGVALSGDDGATYALAPVTLSGDIGPGVTAGVNKHIVWDAGADLPDVHNTSMRFRVTAAALPPAPAGFVRIFPGTFTMGSPPDEPGRGDDETQHSVTLTRAFFLQATEVTNGQWEAVRVEGPARGYTDLPEGYRGGAYGNTGVDFPVTEVSWFDALKWLNLKSELEGLTPCYTVDGAVLKTGTSVPECDFDAGGYRLPTEAEWEYACRAGTSTAFHNGPITSVHSSPDPNLDLIGWYRGNSGGNAHPVAGLQPNAWGLHDMSGNAVEWCWDYYDTYPGTVTDPTGPASGWERVLRGGDYNGGAVNSRSAARAFGYPADRGGDFRIGFRTARTAQQ